MTRPKKPHRAGFGTRDTDRNPDGSGRFVKNAMARPPRKPFEWRPVVAGAILAAALAAIVYAVL